MTKGHEGARYGLPEENMAAQDLIFKKISEALLVDYSSVYYVNAITNEYYWYSVNPEFHSLSLEQGGDDFFKNIIRDCKKVIYKEDQHIFIEDIQKENLLAAMKKGSMQNIEYRLMINGVPTWHSLRMIRGLDDNSDYFILGVINIDEEYKRREKAKILAVQKERYNQIISSLAERFDTLYYINSETGKYIEISSTEEYKDLNVPAEGGDFFAESRKNIRRIVHPEDQERILKLHYKDAMLNKLKRRKSYTTNFRMIVNGSVKNVRHLTMLAHDKKHIIICVENIDEEVKANLEFKRTQERSITYSQIAESLAAQYDIIYYVDARTDYYVEFTMHNIVGELAVQENGEDFFGTATGNADKIIYPDDRERIKLFINKDNLISRLEDTKQIAEDYRMVVDGNDPKYTRMTVSWSSDRSHLIFCIENRDDDVRKENEHNRALTMANEMARRDGLTGTRNITAYHEYEKELQKKIDDKINEPFGIVMCDVNDLKLVNDTQGHKAGDELIKEACKLICRTFAHSPVFRVGGDEFAVVMMDKDFNDRENILNTFRKHIEENIRIGQGPVIASGISEYKLNTDKTVEEIYQRADRRMYENKAQLKEMKYRSETYSSENVGKKVITEERRKLLEALFKSYDVVSDGTYVYLCDMKYDFSKWSKNAVDTYGLPSEYMYGAGDIWEEFIHPDDREAYHKGIAEIFAGNSSGHDMQYRALKTNGEYDVCTCRGVVLRDNSGEPDYFVGTIRSHGVQGHIDTLTGLRNQYGFFDELDSCIKRQAEITAIVVGISKFSEINEVYGYHFGNRVLQLFARKIFEVTGNTGTCYRIDGTKFAIISNSFSLDEVHEKYIGFRNFFREDFFVDNKRILLETNCGVLKLDSFDLDSQTAYACLNFAYVESKSRNQGDLVLFHNDYGDDNKQRLEKIHAIRASIMHGYKGFYLLYQPVVDAQTEQLIGAEALLRWKSDAYGVVPPDQFIPLIEADPLFPELGEWIIREAVYAAKKILKKNPDFVININLSYTQLEKPDFVDMVFRILEEMEYPPEHLCFEVTERCRLLDIDLLKNVIANLKSRGILVALDDFGTGFSSVSIVKDLPFDIIKIDRGFVTRVEEDEVERELIKYFAGLASLFGAKVCVEGVETAGMRDILHKYHVESFQGYYYAKPLELEEMVKYKTKK